MSSGSEGRVALFSSSLAAVDSGAEETTCDSMDAVGESEAVEEVPVRRMKHAARPASMPKMSKIRGCEMITEAIVCGGSIA